MPKALTVAQKKERALAAQNKTEQKEPVIREEHQRTNPEQRTRVRGVFNGTRSKLAVGNNIPGYRLYYFNDEGSRVADAERNGYEFVTPEEVGGAQNNTELGGNKIRIVVGTKGNGEPLYAYLMKIRQEWFDEDQEGIQKKVDAVDNQIRSGKNVSGSSEGFYTPNDGIKVTH